MQEAKNKGLNMLLSGDLVFLRVVLVATRTKNENLETCMNRFNFLRFAALMAVLHQQSATFLGVKDFQKLQLVQFPFERAPLQNKKQ